MTPEELETYLTERFRREREATLDLVVGIIERMLERTLQHDSEVRAREFEQVFVKIKQGFAKLGGGFAKLDEGFAKVQELAEKLQRASEREAYDEFGGRTKVN